jgi:hypothetical protein
MTFLEVYNLFLVNKIYDSVTDTSMPACPFPSLILFFLILVIVCLGEKQTCLKDQIQGIDFIAGKDQ